MGVVRKSGGTGTWRAEKNRYHAPVSWRVRAENSPGDAPGFAKGQPVAGLYRIPVSAMVWGNIFFPEGIRRLVTVFGSGKEKAEWR